MPVTHGVTGSSPVRTANNTMTEAITASVFLFFVVSLKTLPNQDSNSFQNWVYVVFLTVDNLTDFFATLYVKPDFVWMIPCFSGRGTDVTGGQAVGHETRRFEAYS